MEEEDHQLLEEVLEEAEGQEAVEDLQQEVEDRQLAQQRK
jgi:hypothetical protein